MHSQNKKKKIGTQNFRILGVHKNLENHARIEPIKMNKKDFNIGSGSA